MQGHVVCISLNEWLACLDATVEDEEQCKP